MQYQEYVDEFVESYIASLDEIDLENIYKNIEKEFLVMHESTRRWSAEVLRKTAERTYSTRLTKELDILGSLVDSIKRGDLTEEQLLLYFQSNAALLRNNIDSAYARYGTQGLPELESSYLARNSEWCA